MGNYWAWLKNNYKWYAWKYVEDKVKVKLGTFDCWSFTPVVQEGRIWKDDSDLTVYVSADERRIPVLVTSDLLIGSIRLELTADLGLPASDQFLSD